jgi:hypothetical protein
MTCSASGAGTETNPDGTFVIARVSPGTYPIRVWRRNGVGWSWSYGIVHGEGAAPPMEITVGSEPLTGLLVTIQPDPRRPAT